jgi:FkbM family methyltransferase
MQIGVDRDGDWINRQPGITLFSPTVHAQPIKVIRKNAFDLWCHLYAPVEGDTVVDVGAGIGAEAVILGQLLGSTGRLLAIEAHPRTYRCLEKSVRASAVPQVSPIHAAITGKVGPIELSDDRVHNANAIVDGGAESNATVTVSGYPLDVLLRAHGVNQVDLLKMNIEGAEVDALLGAEVALQATRHVVISCHDFIADRGGPELMRTYARVREILESHGFVVTLREDDPRPWVRYAVHGARR